TVWVNDTVGGSQFKTWTVTVSNPPAPAPTFLGLPFLEGIAALFLPILAAILLVAFFARRRGQGDEDAAEEAPADSGGEDMATAAAMGGSGSFAEGGEGDVAVMAPEVTPEVGQPWEEPTGPSVPSGEPSIGSEPGPESPEVPPEMGETPEEPPEVRPAAPAKPEPPTIDDTLTELLALAKSAPSKKGKKPEP
ncbi:MAG: hypothetical protein L3J97_02245, partial [Thermoplasmata archaeon]|nr:hypothetical protein [Thermoplasmata archaeon]